jgi:hypothetical protein
LNVRGQGIINYIISNSQPVFYKSTEIRANSYTGLYIADELKAVINDLGPHRLFALVTDNAVNMKATWSKVEESYPHITPIRFAADALNLLLKDIVALKTTDTPYKRAKEVVRYVKGHQVIAAIYITNQSEKNKSITLKLPSNTRWGGVVIMFDSLLEGSLSKKWSYFCRYVQPYQEDPDDVFWESGKQPETYSSSHCTD